MKKVKSCEEAFMFLFLYFFFSFALFFKVFIHFLKRDLFKKVIDKLTVQ